MNRKALIATYYWPPSGGPGVQRILKFAKYLPEFGVEPVILTVRNPTYPIRDESLLDEIPADLRVYKSRTVEPFRFYAGLQGKQPEQIKPTSELKGKSFRSLLATWIRANIFVPDARAGWLLSATRRARRIMKEESIDTLLTTGPPHSVHLIGSYLKHRHNIRWIADFRDPWSRVYYNRLLPRTDLVEQFDESLERRILEQADEVIVVSRNQAEEFRSHVERGYRVITNGFDHEDFRARPSVSDKFTNLRKPFTIRHVGHVGEAAVPETLLREIGDYSGSKQIRLEFIGDVHPRLPKLIQQLQLDKMVHIKPYQPHLQAIESMCDSDSLLLLVPDLEEMEHHIPGKLFEYLAAQRPILMLGPCGGDSADIIHGEKAGICTPFDDAEAIRSALVRITDDQLHGLTSTPDSSHPYSRRELTRQLSELILHYDPLLGDKPAPPT